MPYCPEAHAALCEEAEAKGLTRKWVARARPHAVGLFRPRPDDPVYDHVQCVTVGRHCEPTEWYVYLCAKHYDRQKGLQVPSHSDSPIA